MKGVSVVGMTKDDIEYWIKVDVPEKECGHCCSMSDLLPIIEWLG